MCGILGSINITYKPETLQSISHRGPDGDGVMHLNENGHQITLAHRRLSIVDLSSNGSQPMATADNNSFMVFNGEIYNHAELREQLQVKDFRGHSDSETLINCMNENAEEWLDRLNGIFAFALYNRQQQKLYLVRDRYGVKPLYYTFQNNTLFFSSELRPFHLHFQLDLKLQEVAESLQMRFVASPETVYAGIHKVEPGQSVVFDLSASQIGMRKVSFIKAKRKTATMKKEYGQLVKEYGSLFEKAVERQLMSDVSIGVFLSGGVDSALVAAVANSKAPKKITAFTVGFKGSHADDETDAARQTAGILGLEHYCTTVDFDNFIDHLTRIIKIVEEPIATSSIVPMYSLAKLASEKVKVVLSGQGADEPLHGYKQYRWLSLLEQCRKHNKKVSAVLSLANTKGSKRENARRFIDALKDPDVFYSYRKYNSILASEDISSLLVNATGGKTNHYFEKNNSRFKEKWIGEKTPSSVQELFPYLDLRTSLPDDLLMYTDKITMNFGIECRVPILDNELVSFIEELDTKYKSSLTSGKIIHKQFAKEYLPAKIINRRKIVFKPPTSEWFRMSMKEIERYLDSSADFKRLFNSDKVHSILMRQANGEQLDKQILLLLSFCCILQKNKDAFL